jgi:hypothetical protein
MEEDTNFKKCLLCLQFPKFYLNFKSLRMEFFFLCIYLASMRSDFINTNLKKKNFYSTTRVAHNN